MLLAGVALLGCAPALESPSPPPPLGECSYGLYRADCGGNAEPVLGCSRSGDCRFFIGGIVAEGYVPSTCPATDICCYEHWGSAAPYPTLATDGIDAIALANETLGVLSHSPPPGEWEAHGLPVVLADLPTPSPRILCSPDSIFTFCPTELTEGFVSTRHIGESLVIDYPSGTAAFLPRLEVLTAPTGELRALLFRSVYEPLHGPAIPVCSHPGALITNPIGSLTLDPVSLEDPTRAHGRLEATFSLPGSPEASILFEF